MHTKNISHGFGTLETLFALALFSILASIVSTVLFQTQGSATAVFERVQAHMLVQEGITAVLTLRDTDADLLLSGTHGLALTDGQWSLSGSEDITGQYTRTISIEPIEYDGFSVTSAVSWEGIRKGAIERTITLYDIFETYGDAKHIVFESGTAGWNTEHTKVQNIRCTNTGSQAHTLRELMLSWEGNAKLKEIIVASSSVYAVATSSAVESGTRIDIDDVTILQNTTEDIEAIVFTEPVSGSHITLQATLDDGSVRNSYHNIE